MPDPAVDVPSEPGWRAAYVLLHHHTSHPDHPGGNHHGGDPNAVLILRPEVLYVLDTGSPESADLTLSVALDNGCLLYAGPGSDLAQFADLFAPELRELIDADLLEQARQLQYDPDPDPCDDYWRPDPEASATLFEHYRQLFNPDQPDRDPATHDDGDGDGGGEAVPGYTARLTDVRTGHHHLTLWPPVHPGGYHLDPDHPDALYEGDLPDTPHLPAWIDTARRHGRVTVVLATDPDPDPDRTDGMRDAFARDVLAWLADSVHAGRAVTSTVPLTNGHADCVGEDDDNSARP